MCARACGATVGKRRDDLLRKADGLHEPVRCRVWVGQGRSAIAEYKRIRAPSLPSGPLVGPPCRGVSARPAAGRSSAWIENPRARKIVGDSLSWAGVTVTAATIVDSAITAIDLACITIPAAAIVLGFLSRFQDAHHVPTYD